MLLRSTMADFVHPGSPFPFPLPLSLPPPPITPGLYYKLHNAHRPVNMKKTTIKRRKRVPPAANVQVSRNLGTSEGEADLSHLHRTAPP